MKKRVYYYDLIRVFAMIMVLLNHTMASHIAGDNCSNLQIVISGFCMTASRLGAPLFLMLSGALCLKKGNDIDFRKVYSKRISKILIPFVVWSTIYFIMYDIIRDQNATIRGLISLVFKPGNAGHLWYLYVLLALYLFLPVFQAIINQLERRDVEYLLILWIVSSGVIHYLRMLGVPAIEDFYANLHIFNGLWGYFLLGWYLSIYELKLKKGTNIIALCLIYISLSGTIIFSTIKNHLFNDNIVSYSGLPIVLMSIEVFLLLKSTRDVPNGVMKKGIEYLSEISFGVYLNQFLARAIVGNIVDKIAINDIISMIFEFVLTTSMSILLATIVYKIPNDRMGRMIKTCLG